MMNFRKYQKLKAMQSFRQKFSEMTKEYRNGFWDDMNRLSEKLNDRVSDGGEWLKSIASNME